MKWRLSINKRNGRFSRSSHLCWRSPRRWTNPPVCLRQRSNHCFRIITTNAARSDIGRLPYRRSDAVMILVGAHSTVEEQRALVRGNRSVDRIARRRAPGRSVGPGGADSGDQASLRMWLAPWHIRRKQNHTKMRVVLRSSSHFCVRSVSGSVTSHL